MKNFLVVTGSCIALIIILSVSNTMLKSELPTVDKILEFQNGATNVNPKLSEMHIIFTEDMDARFSNFEYGPLGEAHSFKIKEYKHLDDKKSFLIKFDLEANKKYQIEVSSGFRSKKGVRINPYLIEFTTSS